MGLLEPGVEILHYTGPESIVADALSRSSAENTDDTDSNEKHMNATSSLVVSSSAKKKPEYR